MASGSRRLAVIAFGGNALLRPEDRGTYEEQIARAKQAARWLAEIVRYDYKLVVVHGNGPQVGNILVQAEEASTKIPPQSLDIAVSQTEGAIGFMAVVPENDERVAKRLVRAGSRHGARE